MEPTNGTLVRGPGLVVLDAAADDATTLAPQQQLAERRATASAARTARGMDLPGVTAAPLPGPETAHRPRHGVSRIPVRRPATVTAGAAAASA
ncbi:DUF6207 family protein [Streptomyces sp. NPDC046862]|uniref:DUF6207 family protein n=1 Tax=Streptomyces sp. NPDC046862 TaxID=3154603 RepID=UPI003451E19D